MSPSEPQQVTVLSTQEMDAARIGMIASIVGGSVMLIAAIFYVTINYRLQHIYGRLIQRIEWFIQ